MREETDPERLRKLPRVTELLTGSGSVITQASFSFYKFAFLMKAA